MRVGRSHRAQLKLPVQLAPPDRSRVFSGETIDLSRGGFSAHLETDERLPAIALALIEISAATGTCVACKAQRVWQGGLPGGVKRVNYRIISIRPEHQHDLDELILGAVRQLVADLGDLPLFGRADIAELEYLLTLARVRECDAGTLLYETDRYDGAGVYVILDGRAVLAHSGGTTIVGRGLICGQWAEREVRAHRETSRAGSALRFLYLPAGFHPEVSVQAPRIAEILREALGGSADGPTARVMRTLAQRSLAPQAPTHGTTTSRVE